ISNSVYLIDDDGVDRLTISAPFADDVQDLQIVLQRSMQDAMLPYDDARQGLIVFSAVLLVLV
ncbi:MAG: hypothetical protein GWN47_08555, partial [Woeseiaceae bacterium]|nr:hypothetical protein [Woeseiaceae bacterium]